MEFTPLDPDLCELVHEAVVEGLAAIEAIGEDEVPRHSMYPSMSEFENGMPSFSTGPSLLLSDDAPKDYGSVIGRAGALWMKIDQDDLPAFRALLNYGRSIQRIIDCITDGHEVSEIVGGVEGVVDFVVSGIATSAIERLCHADGEPGDNAFDEAYAPLEAGLFLHERPFEAVVPLLCTTVEVDRFDIAHDVYVERMDEATQLKRMSLSRFGPVEEVLLGAATHAIVVDGGISRHTPDLFGSDDEFPRARIDAALQAIKIAADVTIGYAEFVVRPLGWATSWRTTMPSLQWGPIERRYPPSLDTHGWLSDPQRLSEEHLRVAKEILDTLAGAPANICQAARRVDRAQIRDDDDDAVVDYCIALEVGDALLLLVIENVWAAGLADALRKAGVVFAQQDYVSPEGLVALGAMLGLEVALDG